MAKKSNNKIELGFKVERSNKLNTLRPTGMNLTEVRFLAIYQAKINARNPETRTVIFPLAEFCKIMEIENLNVTHIKNIADNIICKPIHLPSDMAKNGLMVIPLFNECQVYQDDKTGEWFVKIECHQKALPYMFQMKKNYFTYELWNALKLKSVNQLRMYEILKQYEKIGERTLQLNELKAMLGINNGSQAKYQDFRREVLEVCQRALEEHTDIKFTFEPIRQGRKIHALKFIITKNKNFKDDLRLKEFIKPEDLEDIRDIPSTPDVTTISTPDSLQVPNSDNSDIDLIWLSFDLDDVYSINELENLVKLAKSISSKPEAYLKSIYYQIKARNKKINNLYSYTLSIINADLKGIKEVQPSKTPEKTSILFDDKPSYDLDAYERALFQDIQKFCDSFPKTKEEVAEECHNRPTEPLILDFKDCENYNDVCQYLSDLGEEMSNKYNCDFHISFVKDFKAYCNALYEVYNVEISIKNIRKLEKSLIYASDDETLALKSVLRYFYEHK